MVRNSQQLSHHMHIYVIKKWILFIYAASSYINKSTLMSFTSIGYICAYMLSPNSTTVLSA